MNGFDNFFVPETQDSVRLDSLLKQQFPTYSRTYFQNLIEQGYVLVNGKPLKKRAIPTAGDEIEVCFVLPAETDITPQDIPLDVLYEDEHMLAINKPAGMVVHPAPGHYQDTFVNALLHYCKNLPFSDKIRPGIVHRLDKDTSGVLLAAKTSEAHQNLVNLFATRQVQKKYFAIAVGSPGSRTVNAPIGRHPTDRKAMCVSLDKGKEAISIFRIQNETKPFSLIEVQILTGRTHQIRVHLQYCSTPILGDPVYGHQKINQKHGISRQMLHAYEITLPHPITKEPLLIKAPLASDIQEIIQKHALL